MKDITVAVPDAVYRRARVKAAERDLTVRGLVREFLEGLASAESELDRGKRLQAEVLATVRRFRAGTRLSRDQAHRR